MTVTRTDRRRPIDRRAIVAWSVAATCLVICLVALGIWGAVDELAPDALLFVVLPVAFGGVGALLTSRVPDNTIGPLLLAAIVGFTTLIGGQAWVLIGAALEEPLPGTTFLGLAAGLAFIPSVILVLVGIPLVFPTGRFLGPRWRWVAVATILVVAAAELETLIGTAVVMEVEGLPNPLYRPDLAVALAELSGWAALAAIPIFGLTLLSLVLRYRRGTRIERLQLRWLFAATSVAVVAFALSFNLPDDARDAVESIGLVVIALYPAAIGIAVVRYRLFAIDRIISRTISYGIVTVLLVAAYASVVLILQGPLGNVVGGGTASIAISTLVVAALFQPVRRRVQRVVDRRFDRARFDADRTAAAFSDRLRAEVDIDTVLTDLEATVATAVRPVQTGLWVRGRLT